MAGVNRQAKQRSGRGRERTILIECKQSRADFLRDDQQRESLLALREKLEGIRRSIEERRIKREEPHLRDTESSLFAELEVWDFAASRLPAYRRVLSALRRLDEKLHGQTKFCMIGRYRLADWLYVAAPRGLIRRRELPDGWGLLECSPRWLDPEAAGEDLWSTPGLEVTVEAPLLSSRDRHRRRLLRNIAVAASRVRHQVP